MELKAELNQGDFQSITEMILNIDDKNYKLFMLQLKSLQYGNPKVFSMFNAAKIQANLQ